MDGCGSDFLWQSSRSCGDEGSSLWRSWWQCKYYIYEGCEYSPCHHSSIISLSNLPSLKYLLNLQTSKMVSSFMIDMSLRLVKLPASGSRHTRLLKTSVLPPKINLFNLFSSVSFSFRRYDHIMICTPRLQGYHPRHIPIRVELFMLALFSYEIEVRQDDSSLIFSTPNWRYPS